MGRRPSGRHRIDLSLAPTAQARYVLGHFIGQPTALPFFERMSRRLTLVGKTSFQYGVFCTIGGAALGFAIVGVVAAASSVTQALSTAPLLMGLVGAGCAVLGLIAGALEGMSGDAE